MNISIREYKPEDENDLILCITALQDHERELDTSKKEGKLVARDYWNELLEECRANSGQIFIATDEDNVAGFSCVWIEENDDITRDLYKYGYLSDLYVKPEYRRLGVGTLLINARKDYLKAKGIDKVRVNTLANNVGIQETLKAQGFTQYEITWEASI